MGSGSSKLVSQAASFAVVGALNTGFCYGVYLLSLYVGLSYSIAMLCATALTMAMSYFLMGRLVFASAVQIESMAKFLAMHIVGYFLNISLIKLAVTAGMIEAYAGLISLALLATYTFVVSRVFVFVESNQLSEKTC